MEQKSQQEIEFGELGHAECPKSDCTDVKKGYEGSPIAYWILALQLLPSTQN